MKSKLKKAVGYLKEIGADGWLIYDFHGSNELARTFLEIPPEKLSMRRYYYWIPVKGTPVKIVHAIESGILDGCPGKKLIYASWISLENHLKKILKGVKRVAMEYSPGNAIPYASKVDAGTVDSIRALGVEVVSSAPFIPHFTAVLTEEQAKSHFEAAKVLDCVVDETWRWIAGSLRKKKKITDFQIQQKMLHSIDYYGCETEDPPMVSFNALAADPHHMPSEKKPIVLKMGDFILLDLWCKKKGKKNVYADITRVGIAADKPTLLQQKIFKIVKKAQVAATDFIRKRLAAKKQVLGFEADDVARGVIKKAGYGEYFTHRTGHNIEVNIHGSGAFLDNLEMHDVRPLLPGTCFSVEPGIYLPGKFGIRLEYDIYIHKNGKIEVTGGDQKEITCLF